MARNYLVELGLAGEGGRGLYLAQVVCSRVTPTLRGRKGGSPE